MGAGSYQGVCSTLSAGRVHLVHERQNRLILKSGVMPGNTCTVSFALGQDPLKRFSHFLDPAPLTFLLPEHTDFEILVPGEVDTLYLSLEQDRLMSGARTLNPRFWERAPRGLQAYNTPDTGKLASALLGLLGPDGMDAQSSSPRPPAPALHTRAESLLYDDVLLALDKATTVLDSDTPEFLARQRARQRVNAARDFMHASLQAGLLPSIVDICAQTRSSVRTLQYAFHEIMQMTPVAYLRTLRLNEVRRALQSAASSNTTVTQIATHWGFLHLGEFSRDYLRLFGERPSQTLTQAQALDRRD